jgi:hypothetical protein
MDFLSKVVSKAYNAWVRPFIDTDEFFDVEDSLR